MRLGPASEEHPSGAGIVEFKVKCNTNAHEVLGKVRQLLLLTISSCSESNVAADDEIDQQDIDLSVWANRLPEWFVDACRDELDAETVDKLIRLPLNDRVAHGADEWSLQSWLYWFVDDENRYWRWWDAKIENQESICVAIEVDDPALPWGALKWAFIAAGAIEVFVE